MKKVGIVGWCGRVGSVLLDRMSAEGGAMIDPVFFSTSQPGRLVMRQGPLSAGG